MWMFSPGLFLIDSMKFVLLVVALWAKDFFEDNTQQHTSEEYITALSPHNLKHESHKNLVHYQFNLLSAGQKNCFCGPQKDHKIFIPSIINCILDPKEFFTLLRRKDVHRHLVLSIFSRSNNRFCDCWNFIKLNYLLYKMQNGKWNLNEVQTLGHHFTEPPVG